MEFYTEQIKQKKNVVINLPMLKTDDGRHWVELESFMTGIAKVNKSDIKKYTSHIPKPYFKTIEKNKNKVKYVDRLALGMIASQLDNYELYKFTVSRTNNKIDNYAPMLFFETFVMINNKLGNISFLRNELGNADKARNDLLHNNEKAEDLNQKEKVSFYDSLAKLQRERRKIKVQLEYLTTFNNFFENHKIKGSEIVELFNSVNGLMNVSYKKIYNNRATTTESKKFL